MFTVACLFEETTLLKNFGYLLLCTWLCACSTPAPSPPAAAPAAQNPARPAAGPSSSVTQPVPAAAPVAVQPASTVDPATREGRMAEAMQNSEAAKTKPAPAATSSPKTSKRRKQSR